MATLSLQTAGPFTYIFPAQRSLAAFTVDIGDGVKPSQENSFLRRPAAHVHSTKTQKKNKLKIN